MNQVCSIILAAGNGTRMKSARSKVLCEVLFQPMIQWVLENCAGAGISDCCVVVGKNAEDVRAVLPENVQTAVQTEQRGTGHAVRSAEEFIRAHLDCDVLVVYGDAPFFFPDVLRKAYDQHRASGAAMTAVSAVLDNPFGYGRMIHDEDGLTAIIEEKDATDEQRQIHEINAGAYWFQAKALLSALAQLSPANAQGEYYLTDTLAILKKDGYRIESYRAEDSRVVLGANSRRQLAQLNEAAREFVFDALYDSGVNIPVTDGVIISRQAKIGRDTTILPGTIIKNGTVVGENCVIGPNSMLDNATIGNCCEGKSTWRTRAVLEDDVQIGPFSQVRPDSRLCRGVRVGDFVEIKNSVIGEDTHSAHLTYIGDSDVGARCNFGCGVAIANYNGKKKFRSVIGNDCFIGCNTNLVSPVHLEDGAYTAAGSTVTIDVPADSVCIARAREVIKPGLALSYRKEPKK